MKLLAYQISGQTVGIELDKWSVDELSGNNAFISINDNDSIPENYVDISSINNWGLWGQETDLTFCVVRAEIKNFLNPEQLIGNLSGLTTNEIETIDSYNLSKYYKIFEYMNNTTFPETEVKPQDINFDIVGFNKKRIFNKGELNQIDYYGYVDSGGTHQDLILTEYREYYRANRMVYKRKLDIIWYYNDGTSGDTKTTNKHYSSEESIKLGERRRRNVISDLKIGTIGLIQMISGSTQIDATMIGLTFLAKVTNEITQYIEGIEDPLKNKVLTHDDAECDWLNAEIPNAGGLLVRQYLYSAIDIDYSDRLE